MNVWGSGFVPIIIYATQNAGPAPGAKDLLTEDGEFILTETEERIQTET